MEVLRLADVEKILTVVVEPVGARNARDLADKIAYLTEHPEINARLRRNARPYVVRNYSWPSIAERAAAVYREVLAEHRLEKSREVKAPIILCES